MSCHPSCSSTCDYSVNQVNEFIHLIVIIDLHCSVVPLFHSIITVFFLFPHAEPHTQLSVNVSKRVLFVTTLFRDDELNVYHVFIEIVSEMSCLTFINGNGTFISYR